MSEEDKKDNGSGAEQNMVPLWRFKQETDELKSKLSTQTEELFTLRAMASQYEAKEAALVSREEEWATKLSQASEDRDLFRLGFSDDSGLEVLRFFHGKLGADAPAITEWATSLKADPEKAPIAIRGYLGGAGIAAGQVNIPKNSNVVTEQPAASPSYSSEDLSRMSVGEYRDWKEAIQHRAKAGGRAR